MSAVDPLLLTLKIREEDLAVLPDQLIERALKVLALPLQEEAAFFIELRRLRAESSAPGVRSTETGSPDSLLTYLRRQTELAREGWRLEMDRADLWHSRNDEALAHTDAFTRMRAKFADRAKAGLLRPSEAFLCGVLLEDDPLARLRMCSLLLSVDDPDERIRLMNFRFISRQDPATQAQRGQHISTLGVPLFTMDSLAMVNEKIYDEYVTTAGGGSRVFKTEDRGGEYLLPIGTDATGRPAVDIEVVRTEFARLRGEMEAALASTPQAAENWRRLVALVSGSRAHDGRATRGRGRGPRSRRGGETAGGSPVQE